MTRTITAAAVVLLALTGCTSTAPTPAPAMPASSPTTTQEAPASAQPDTSGLPTWTTGPAAWTCSDRDHDITYRIQVPPVTNQLADDFEAVRVATGTGGAVTYLTVDVDATNATEPAVPAREVTWATTEHQTVRARTLDEASADLPTDGQLVDLVNLDSDNASPARGAEGSQLFVIDGELGSMVGVTVTTSWYDVVMCDLS